MQQPNMTDERRERLQRLGEINNDMQRTLHDARNTVAQASGKAFAMMINAEGEKDFTLTNYENFYNQALELEGWIADKETAHINKVEQVFMDGYREEIEELQAWLDEDDKTYQAAKAENVTPIRGE